MLLSLPIKEPVKEAQISCASGQACNDLIDGFNTEMNAEFRAHFYGRRCWTIIAQASAASLANISVEEKSTASARSRPAREIAHPSLKQKLT
jgi:hypothetical protein